MKGRILRPNGDTLEYDAAEVTKPDSPFCFNNTVSSLFCECSLTANGIKISDNAHDARKALIETEFSLNKEAKDTWLKCHGSSCEEEPVDFW